MRREIPLIITTIMTIMRFLFETVNQLATYEIAKDKLLFTRMAYSITFLYAMGLFIGFINLTRVHANNIKRRKENWPFSAWLIFVLFAYTILGIFGKDNLNGVTFNWIYDAFIVPLDSTMFSLLAFFIASAAYRAFRIRNVEATVMLVVAFLVMLGNVSIGQALWGAQSWLGGFSGIKDWILAVPNAASQRAVALGIFLGAYAAILRVALGLEKRYLGQD